MKTNFITLGIIFFDLALIILKADLNNIVIYIFLSFALIFLLNFSKITFLSSIIILFIISGLNRYFLENFGITNIDTIFLFILIIFLFFFQKHQLIISKYNVKIFLFILFFFISYTLLGAINSNVHEVFNFLKIGVKNLGVFFLAIIILNNEGKQDFLKIALYFCIFISLLGIYDWNINSDSFYSSDYFYRSSGLVGNPNIQGQLIVITGISLFSLINNRSIDPSIGLFYIGFIIFSLLITQSRGSLLVFSILLVLFFLSNRNIKTEVKTLILLLTPLFVRIITKKSPHFLNRIIEGGSEDYSNGRIDAVLAGFKSFYSNLFGVGIGNTSNNVLNMSSHNFYIHVISEAGVFILPVLITMIGGLIYLCIKITKESFIKNEFLISNYFLISILLMGLFTHNLIYHTQYYFLLPIVGAELLLIRKIEEHEEF